MVSRCLLIWRKSRCQPLLPCQSGCTSFPSRDSGVTSPTTSIIVSKTSCGRFSELHGRQHDPAKPTQLNSLPCKAGWPWTCWVPGSSPGPRRAWQSLLRREGAAPPQAGACAHASALISLLIEPLNVLPLPEPCCCFSFLPLSECLFIVIWNKWKKNSYKLFVPWKIQEMVSLLGLRR